MTARQQIVGRDGLVRGEEQEAQLADLCLAALHEGAGARLLAYLRNITLNRVLGPGASDAELRHHEGARALVAMLITRIDDARANRTRGAHAAAGGAEPGA